MIGSVTEAWREMAELALRRQAIADQGAAAAAPAGTGRPAREPVITGLIPGPLAGAAPMALKAAEPDVAKRKSRGGKRPPSKEGKRDPADGGYESGDYAGQDLRDDDAGTDAHDMARGAADAARAGDARKGYSERGSQEGPGSFADPVGPSGPETSVRPYITDGHAAPSPGHGAPRSNPIAQPFGRGIPTLIEMPSAPVIAGHAGPLTAAVAAHEARVTLRTPIPGGTPR